MKQQKKVGDEEESIEFSQNLVRIFETRYNSQAREMDILDLVREYYVNCLQTGNHFQNTKYCILYILKTHKVHYDLFKKL